MQNMFKCFESRLEPILNPDMAGSTHVYEESGAF